MLYSAFRHENISHFAPIFFGDTDMIPTPQWRSHTVL